MIRTFLELSTAHLPEHEMNLVTTLIVDLGLWDQAFDGPTGCVLWVGYQHNPLCPPMLKNLLERVSVIFPDAPYIMLNAEADTLSVFDTFEWIPPTN